MSDGEIIGRKVAKMIEKHAACNYLLDEIMAYIIKNEDKLPNRLTEVEWMMRTYKKYNNME